MPEDKEGGGSHDITFNPYFVLIILEEPYRKIAESLHFCNKKTVDGLAI